MQRRTFTPLPYPWQGLWDFVFDELKTIAEAVQRFLDSDGNRHAIGDLDELHEAVDCLEAYQDFQPDRFDRRELNRQLRTLAQDREVRL